MNVKDLTDDELLKKVEWFIDYVVGEEHEDYITEIFNRYKKRVAEERRISNIKEPFLYRSDPKDKTKPFGVSWVFTQKYEHSSVTQFAISLVDLTTDIGVEAVLDMKGATHEVLVMALDPTLPPIGPHNYSKQKFSCIMPQIRGYQFISTDEEAYALVEKIVNDCVAGKLLVLGEADKWANLIPGSTPKETTQPTEIN